MTKGLSPAPAIGCAALLLACFQAGQVHAGEMTADEDIFLAPLPYVLTASRLAQAPSEAPAPITIIDREMIAASGFTEIVDLLRLVPGFLVADWPSGSPTVVNHGMGDAYGRRLLVMIDGRSVLNPLRGNVNWETLPIRVEDIERIEVVRGPNAASYGANAMQGVVNIITRSPRTESGDSVLVRAGNKDFFETAARINGSEGDVDWRITASRRRAANFENQHRNHFQVDETLYLDVFNGQLSWQPSNQDELRFQFGYAGSKDWTGAATVVSPTHYKTSDNDYLHLDWRHTFALEQEFSLQYYHLSRSERDSYVAYASGVDFNIPVNRNVDILRDDIEAQYMGQLGENLMGVLGAGVRQDQIRSDHYFYGEGDVGGTQWQVFGNLAWHATPSWLFNAGGMLEKHYNTDTLFSPRVAANYDISPDQVIRFSAGYGYRAPTATEANSLEQTRYQGQIYQLGQWSRYPVDPEHVRFHEIGYLANLRGIHLNIDARLFWEHHSGYLDDQNCRFHPSTRGPYRNECPFPAPADFNPDQSIAQYAHYYINSGDIYLRGADLSLDWNPGWGRIVFNQSVANAHTTPGFSDADLEKSVPAYTASLLAMHTFPGAITASVGLYHVAEMYWLNDGDVVPRRTRTDLRLAKAFGPGNVHEAAITVQALEGSYPEFHEGRYTAERRVFASLRLGF